MILVLHPGALGDLILALPALAALRSHFTGAHITIAGNQDYLRVIARGYADELLSLSVLPLHRLFSPDPLPPDDIRSWRSYHKVVSWTGAGDAVFERQLISANSAALIRSWRPEPGETRSVSRRTSCRSNRSSSCARTEGATVQAKQLRDLDDGELLKQAAELRKDLFGLRFANATGELDDTARLGRVKRDLARVLTVARERELAAPGKPS